jgi:hypothetical protein
MGFDVKHTIYVIITGCLPHIILNKFISHKNKILIEKIIIILTKYIEHRQYNKNKNKNKIGGGGGGGAASAVVGLVVVVLVSPPLPMWWWCWCCCCHCCSSGGGASAVVVLVVGWGALTIQ